MGHHSGPLVAVLSVLERITVAFRVASVARRGARMVRIFLVLFLIAFWYVFGLIILALWTSFGG